MILLEGMPAFAGMTGFRYESPPKPPHLTPTLSKREGEEGDVKGLRQ
jgi:hypothetical protein